MEFSSICRGSSSSSSFCDLNLTLGLPSAEDPRVSPHQLINPSAAPSSTRGFSTGACAGEAPVTDTTSTIMEFQQRSVSVTERRQLQVLPAPTAIKEYCLINVSITRGKVGGSKKRKTPHAERPIPRPEDRNRTCTNFNCQTSVTPMWRRGPLGPKTLCNACGIKFRKSKLKGKQGEGSSGEGSSNAS